MIDVVESGLVRTKSGSSGGNEAIEYLVYACERKLTVLLETWIEKVGRRWEQTATPYKKNIKQVQVVSYYLALRSTIVLIYIFCI
jgi:hypothetical protein